MSRINPASTGRLSEAALCRNEDDAGNESSETEDELLEELFRDDDENGVDKVEN